MINPRVTFRVDSAGLQKDIRSSLPRLNSHNAIEANARDSSGQLISKKIKNLFNEMVTEFMAHPITREINAGPTSFNISGTLGGYGNLFTFIGFNNSDKPIEPIVKLLQQSNYRFTNFNNYGAFEIIIEIPSAEQIFRATPLPWAPGISWAQRIEVGLSGLGGYMNTTSDSSRSGAGIQTKNMIRGGSFSNTTYISKFIKSWENRFKSIGSVIKF